MLAARTAARLLSGVQAPGRRLDLAGVMPPITTPFRQDEDIAFDMLAANLKVWETMPFKGYVVQGSNGEYPLMTPDERVEMVKRVRQLIPQKKLLIAGASCESTKCTITMANEMAAAGANAVMVLPPCYFKSNMTPSAIQEHFEQVADKVHVPVIVYNMPANTNIDLSASLLATLAQHPNIIGVKDSGGDITKMGRVVHETKDLDFQVLAGSTGFLLPSLLVGCVGGINGLANILGHEVCKLHQLFSEGNLKEAVNLHLRLIAPNAVVTRELGVPAMKEAMDMVGLYGGPCRRPLLPLTELEKTKVRSIFAKAGY